MITKRLLSVYTLLVTGFVFMLTTTSTIAQTYPNATATSSNNALNTSVTSPNNAGGSDMTNAAVINSSVVVNGNWVQVTWPASVNSGTPVYIKVGTETTLLQGVLGGGLGNLVGNLAALLVDGQYIRVSARTSSGEVSASVIDGNYNNDSSTTTKIIQDSAGNYYIRYVPSGNFTSIRIENFRTGVAGAITTRSLSVFGAFYGQTVNSCTVGNYTSYTGGGILTANLGGNSVYTTGNLAIDASPTTASTLSIGTAGVAAYAEQQFYFEGTNTASDTYNVRLGLNPQLLSTTLLERISIRAYSTINSTTPFYTVSAASLLPTDLLALLQNNTPVSVNFAPGGIAAKIGIRISGVASASLAQTLSIYSVTKGNFTVSVAGGGTVLQNAPVTLTATVSGCGSGYTYSWSGGSTPLGTASTASPSTATVGATTYTVTVTDSFGVSRTGTATVTVSQPPTAGSVSGAGAICYGDTPGNLTLIGSVGNVVRWERSTSSTFSSNITQIANATTTLPGTQIGALTETTYFRAIVTQNGYPEVPTTPVAFTVNSSTWNGTAWSNGTPNINTMIFITGNYTTAANLFGCAMVVSNNAVVDIPSGYTITLNGYIQVQSGSSFTLQNNTHLIQLTDATNSGNININRNTSSLFRLDYTLWSAPVTGAQTLKTFSPLTLDNRFYDYYYGISTVYGPGEYFWGVTPTETSFSAAKSFLIRMPNSDATAGYNSVSTQIVKTYTFTGVPNNGGFTRPISTQGNRWTNTGNPYPSPISVQDFFDANEGVMQGASALYFWRKKNDTNASSYAIMTRDIYVSNTASGGIAGDSQYGGAEWDSFFNDSDPSTWVINPGQGFFIQGNSVLSSGNIVFNNAMRRNVHNAQFFKSAAPDNGEGGVPNSRYWISMAGTGTYGELGLVYSNTATLGLDAGRDAKRFNESSPLTIYTLAENTALVAQARPAFTDTDVVPMGYNAAEAGTYTISVKRKDGVFNNQDIYLRDLVEGITRNITQNDYTFGTEAGSFDDRFELFYTTSSALGTENPVATTNNVIVYQNNAEINISAGQLLINSVKVYDVRGRMLYAADGIKNTQTTISGLSAQQEVLLVEVNTVNGTVTKKIVY